MDTYAEQASGEIVKLEHDDKTLALMRNLFVWSVDRSVYGVKHRVFCNSIQAGTKFLNELAKKKPEPILKPQAKPNPPNKA